jgi:hypothetical protein
VRYIEALTAFEAGIPFGEEWYSIPVEAREQMIATRIAHNTLTNLITMQANAKGAH